jgi:mannose-6-phosphate isomerase-like protein (cupin superfamily)
MADGTNDGKAVQRTWSGRTPENRGNVCESLATKERFEFHPVNAAGALPFDFFVGPGGGVAMRHHHLHQRELFRVKRGELTVHLQRGNKVLRAGDEITLAPGEVHAFTNAGAVDVECYVEYQPAGRNEEWLKLGNALAMKLGRMPGLLDIAPFIGDVGIYIEGPPPWVQRALFAVLRVVATVLGKKQAGLAAAREAYGPDFRW